MPVAPAPRATSTSRLRSSTTATRPTRRFCDHVLKRLGVKTVYYDPLIGGAIAELITKKTRVVFAESPGSQTFEVQDVPAIADEAHRRGAFVIMDNTWASPLYFKPFEHGVDISIQAATKYIVGHSDALLGVATANRRAWDLLRDGAHDFGQTAGPDDINLALRGLRTLAVRLRQHQNNALALAQRLGRHPAVARVLHPALPGDAGHAATIEQRAVVRPRQGDPGDDRPVAD